MNEYLTISKPLLAWFDLHGRHDLPWQKYQTAYTTWLSEVMLQQTQVTTVIPYFNRFIEAFPTVMALAAASEETVLTLWSGLGYYSRGRNLLKTAKIIASQYHGAFPENAAELIQLPGIGRSTAHAILSLAFNQPTAILDGNVKRVLCRLLGVTSPPSDTKVEKQLWLSAQALMPEHRCGDYTQAIMDLGATVCTRTKPKCQQCPLQQSCFALQHQCVNELPKPKPKKTKPIRHTILWLIKNQHGQLLLEKRVQTGLWGGLWCFPGSNEKVFSPPFNASKIPKPIAQFRHTFTHFHLDITVAIAPIADFQHLTNDRHQWHKQEDIAQLAIPKPIRQVLEFVE